MIIITVIFILAMSLSGMVISTRMQFNKTDAHNKATDLAEMGITYYQTAINSLIPPAEESAKNNINTSFCAELIKQNDLKKSEQTSYKTVDENNGYQITSSTINCTDGSKVVIDFNSKGKADQEEVNIKGKFTISKGPANSRVGESPPDVNRFSIINSGSITINNNDDQSYNSSISYTGDLTIKGSLTVNNDAYFHSLNLLGDAPVFIQGDGIINQFSMNGHTNLTINGDAIFLNPSLIDKQTQKAVICIKGNIYKTDSNYKLEEFTDYSDFFINSCQNDTSNWGINGNNGITIQY